MGTDIKRHARASRITPNTRVIVAIDRKGRVIASAVAEYKGGRVSAYYKGISVIENRFREECRKEDTPCRVYTGTATSVGSFLNLFPEVTSPF